MVKKIFLLIILGVLFVLPACAQMTPSPTDEIAELTFEPKLTMFESGKVHFELGIANTSGKEQAMVEGANILAVITDEDGQIRNQMTIVDRPKISSGETVFPLTYDAIYDPGSYTISISGEGVPPLSVPFEIREIEGFLK